MNYQERILSALADFEKNAGTEVLFACESGSRAWGLASPDSDYDVRFIYRRSVDWYLSLEKQRDTAEWFSEDRELDFSGWDLKKALTLFDGGNATLYEQLNSPIVYRQNDAVVSALRALIARYFRPKKAFFHYFKLAENHWKVLKKDAGGEITPTSSIKIKTFFYMLRAILACRWIFADETQPPTEIARLLEHSTTPEIVRLLTLEAIEIKKTADERQKVVAPPELVAWTLDALDDARRKSEIIIERPEKRGDGDLKTLSEFFANVVKRPI